MFEEFCRAEVLPFRILDFYRLHLYYLHLLSLCSQSQIVIKVQIKLEISYSRPVSFKKKYEGYRIASEFPNKYTRFVENWLQDLFFVLYLYKIQWCLPPQLAQLFLSPSLSDWMSQLDGNGVCTEIKKK